MEQHFMATMRLQKALAQAGVASRRAAEALIAAGRVSVDGQTVRELGTKVDPQRQMIAVDGKEIRPEAKVHYALHKPSGVVSTVRDPQGRPTVRQLLSAVRQRIYPVGRLDAETTGLLLLTNDGELANRLMHPRYEVKKEYIATVRGTVSESTLRKLAAGIDLDDGPTAPARVRRLGEDTAITRVSIEIHEGRNRQVRRMFATVGHPVIALHRVRVGPIRLDSLPAGAYRPLTPDEIRKLYRLVEL